MTADTDHRTAPPPMRRYATCDADNKPTYHLDEPVLPFSESVRIAALDVMILMYAARRHADWLAEIGECPADVKKLIQGHIERITDALGLSPPAPPPTPDAGPCSRAARGLGSETDPLFGATRGNECDERKRRI